MCSPQTGHSLLAELSERIPALAKYHILENNSNPHFGCKKMVLVLQGPFDLCGDSLQPLNS